MDSIIISSSDRQKLKPVIDLARKSGMSIKVLSKQNIQDFEDARILNRIDLGRKSGLADRSKVLKKLGVKK